ncbi:MAG: N-acetylmuramoyl-L-alanine amidase [Myxococcota bacterium]
MRLYGPIHRPLAFLTGLLFLLGGTTHCAPPPEAIDVVSELDPADNQVVLMSNSLTALQVVDGHVHTPWLTPDGGATQTALMVDLFGPHPDALSIQVEVRERDPHGHHSPWFPAAVSFAEGHHRVYVHRSSRPVHSYQLRLTPEAIAHIQSITWAADRVEQPPYPNLGPHDHDRPAVEGQQRAQEQQATTSAFRTRRQRLATVYANAGVVSRETWGAQETACTSQNVTKDKIAIHHTVSAANTDASQLRQVQNFHMSGRGWCDIGYHFLVTIDGQIWEGRPVQFLGSHVGGHNTNNIGVSFVGCFHPTSACANLQPDVPPEVMIQNAGTFLALLVSEYGITVNAQTLKGHRDHEGSSTACPGDNLHDRLDELRAAALGDPPDPQPGVIRGVIYDRSVTDSPSSEGNVRLDNATVTCDCGLEATVSPGDAQWSFHVEPGRWTITASAPGYTTSSETRTVAEGETVWASVGLVPASDPVEPIPFRITMYDGVQGPGTAVEGAWVQIGNGGASATTDANGVAELTTREPDMALTVSKEGYQTLTMNITLNLADPQPLAWALMPLETMPDPPDAGSPDPPDTTLQPSEDTSTQPPDTMAVGSEAISDTDNTPQTTTTVVKDSCSQSGPASGGRTSLRPGLGVWGLALWAGWMAMVRMRR